MASWYHFGRLFDSATRRRPLVLRIGLHEVMSAFRFELLVGLELSRSHCVVSDHCSVSFKGGKTLTVCNRWGCPILIDLLLLALDVV